MTDDTRIRVLIVDDSAVVRGSLGRIIDAEPDMHVVTTAVHGQDALDALRHTIADVVLLDIEMPVMDGLTALPLMLERVPALRVIMSSSLTHDGASVTMRALALGAVDFIHKPSARDGVQGLRALSEQLVAKVRAIGRGTAARVNARVDARVDTPVKRVVENETRKPITPLLANPTGEIKIVTVAASTGGPNALADFVRALPADFPFPILVTQHMPPIFTQMLAQRLSREGALVCEEARDGCSVEAGRIYIAPGDYHMVVTTVNAAPVIRLTQGAPENHCRPSADPMFRSVAQVYGNGTLAVVLTGMGDDGRRGCEVIAQAGGRIVVQDEATSVVWGMPGSVVEAGIPCSVLALSAIAPYVVAMCTGRRHSAGV